MISSGEGPSYTVDVCRSADPLGLREEERSDDVESFDAKESDELRGELPVRCEVTYGLRPPEVVRRGSGE